MPGVMNIGDDSQNKQKKILKAAESVFAAKGLAGARVNEIASRAGVNKRMLYHYFGQKEDLYTAVLKANLEKIYSIQDVFSQNVFSSPAGVIEQIKNAVRKYFYFLAANPNFVRLIEWEILQDSGHLKQLFPQYDVYNLPAIKDILEKGIKKGVFHADIDGRQLVLSVNAMCFLYFNRVKVLSSTWGEDMLSPPMLEKRLQHILQVLFRAILREGTKAT